MADINAYALGLELQLQTKSAMDSLSFIEKKLQGIEQKMAGIAPSAVATANYEKQAQAVGLNAMERHELEKATNALMEVEREWQVFNDKIAHSAEFLNMSLEEQQKHQQKLTDKYMVANKAVREIGKSYKDFNETEKDMFELGVDIAKQMDEAFDQRKQTDEQLEAYTKHLKLFKPILDAAGISQEGLTKFLQAYTIGLGGAFITITMLGKGLKDVMAIQDAYAKTTFRALGSQLEMIDNTNRLRSTLGATAEQAVKTFTALVNVGFRAADAISELADANYMFSHSTGVSEDTTAGYQRRLTSMGFTATDATQSLGKMSAMIRNSGLSAQAAGQLISGLNKSLMRLNFAFGPKQAKETGEMIAKMGAAAHAAGGESDLLSAQLGNLSTDTVELQRIMGATGIGFDETASRSQNLQRLMKGAADGFRGLGVPAEYATKVMRDMGFEDVILNADLMNKKAKELGMTFDQYVSSIDQGADLTEDFNKATATFKESLQRILAPLMTIGAQLMNVIGPAIVALLKPFVMLATVVGNVISFLDRIPGVSLLLKGAVFMMILPAIYKGISAFTGFGKAFTGLMGLFKGGIPTFKTVGAMLTSKVASMKLLSHETLGFTKSMLSGKASIAGFGAVLKSAIGGVAKPTLLSDLGKVAGAAEGAGAGLEGMGGGALSAALNLAKVHPVITAIVVAIGAAFLVVPKLFEMFDKGNDTTKALAMGLMALLAPLVVLYVQLRTLWAIVKGVWEAVSEMMAEAFKPLVDVWKELTGGPGKQTVSLMEFMNKAMNKVTLVVKGLVKAFSPLVLVFKAIGVVVKFVAEAIKFVVDKFKPLVEWVEKAIQKVSKFLGIEDEMTDKADEAAEAAQDMRTPFEKMWGTQKQVNEAMERQQEIMREAAKEARALDPKVIQTIKATYSPPTRQAEPVVSPVITDKTARVKQEEHQDKILAANYEIFKILSKMLGKADNKTDMGEMIELLKTWLPKIAEEKASGLATAANQWL